jgi:hypothetical protein
VHNFACFKSSTASADLDLAASAAVLRQMRITWLPGIDCGTYELNPNLRECSGVGAIARLPVGFDVISSVAAPGNNFGTVVRIDVLTSLRMDCPQDARPWCIVG